MMEGAFFVSRSELLEWVNRLLEVSLTKVEQCASGAIYCQIVDATYPGTVKMAKVNWMARSDHEFIPNYKILQAAFDRNSIQKHVPVDQLIRAKYQDNLGFLQWMKAMWDREGSGRRDYEPVKGREGKPAPAWAKASGPPGAKAPAPSSGVVDKGAKASALPSGIAEKENLSRNRKAAAEDKFDPSARRAAATATTKAASAPSQRGLTPRSGAKPQLEVENETLKQQLTEQTEEAEELRETLNGMENERDYYFRKLRKVEILCGTLKAKMDPNLDVEGIIAQVQGILYEENDDDPEEAVEVDAAEKAPSPDNRRVTPETEPIDAPELPTVSVEQGSSEAVAVA
jgi:RP/EB family microtubule-associated protein